MLGQLEERLGAARSLRACISPAGLQHQRCFEHVGPAVVLACCVPLPSCRLPCTTHPAERPLSPPSHPCLPRHLQATPTRRGWHMRPASSAAWTPCLCGWRRRGLRRGPATSPRRARCWSRRVQAGFSLLLAFRCGLVCMNGRQLAGQPWLRCCAFLVSIQPWPKTCNCSTSPPLPLYAQARLKNPKNPQLWLAAVRTEMRAQNTKAAEALMAKALQVGWRTPVPVQAPPPLLGKPVTRGTYDRCFGDNCWCGIAGTTPRHARQMIRLKACGPPNPPPPAPTRRTAPTAACCGRRPSTWRPARSASRGQVRLMRCRGSYG